MSGKFGGFSGGKTGSFSLPTDFIGKLLPLIDDFAELQVTLFAFYAVQQREGQNRHLRLHDFKTHLPLLRALTLTAPKARPETILAKALDAACNRGTLLRGDVEDAKTGEVLDTLYFINTEAGRAAVAQIERGEWKPTRSGEEIEILPERPNLYGLYEQHIGPLTPMIADALKDAERDYPAGWAEEAIGIAVELNARNWRFIQAILERWKREGKREGKPDETAQESVGRDGQRFVGGQFSDFIER